MKKILSFLFIFFLVQTIFAKEKIDFSNDFLNYIMVCENGIKKGWYKNQWVITKGIVGYNIGYGHLICLKKNFNKKSSKRKIEKFKHGISEEKAQKILKKDLNEAYLRARKYLKKKYNCNLETLTIRQKEIIIDFSFNGCLPYFPKMMKAVIDNDISTQRKEYKRYVKFNGKKIELKDRNKRFYERYLK